MRVTGSLTNLAIRALTESLDVQIMIIIVQQLLDNYDIHKRTGIPENIPIQKKQAATQIINDIKEKKLYANFINCLINMHYNGHMGKKHPIKHLREIIKEMGELGIIYDRENEIFVEDPNVQRTRNWGALLDGEEYILSFLRMDIVSNSKLVREHPNNIIQETYSDFRRMVMGSIEKRNGRVWNWEGDGGLIAFFFSEKHLLATLSAMEIIHKLFFYNLFECKLKKPLTVRFAVNSGPLDYTDDDEEILKNDTIKKVIEIEAKHTKPNTLTISDTVENMLDTRLLELFKPVKADTKTRYYNYDLTWEK